jgi:DNA-directed RNA polymerase subunit RPC12/RpoP
MLDKVSPIAWLLEHDIKTETGKPYDLKNHAFWYDVICDMSPKQVILKAAQVGGSVMMNLKLFWVVKNKQMNVIYTMPTSSDVKDFVGGKTNPLIVNNPILQEYILDKDSIEQKRIGNNTVYFRGTWTDRAALSVSSDLNIYDEVDRSKREVVEQYSSRLQHSDHKWEWYFSNPSVKDNGVDKYWERSDKKHWINECPHCGQKQFLSWPDSVDLEKEIYVCKSCGEEMPDEARRKGFWHATAEGDYSGYWVNLMMVPNIPASYVIEKFREKPKDIFYNFVLGLPYSGEGSKLSEEQFFANLTTEAYAIEEPIVIGVDTGLPIWYTVGNRQGLFAAGHCKNYDEIRAMMNRWRKAIVVMDQGGDLIGARELQEEFPGRVFLCYYRNDRKTMKLVDWGKGEENGKVIADRNRMIQLVMDELKSGRVPLRGVKENWWETWTHFKNVFRTLEEDSMGNERYVWGRSGPDHLLHAMVYWRIGMDKFGVMSEKSVSTSELIDNLPKSIYVDPLTQTTNTRDWGISEKSHDWRDV